MDNTIQTFKMGDHEAWRSVYNEHEILVVYKGRIRLLIDGTEVAAQKGRLPIASKLNLIGNIPGSDELVIVTVNGSMKNEYKGFMTEVHIYIGKELEKDHGIVDSSRKFTHVEHTALPTIKPDRKKDSKKPRKITIRRNKQ